jgi:hypothetical protein
MVHEVVNFTRQSEKFSGFFPGPYFDDEECRPVYMIADIDGEDVYRALYLYARHKGVVLQSMKKNSNKRANLSDAPAVPTVYLHPSIDVNTSAELQDRANQQVEAVRLIAEAGDMHMDADELMAESQEGAILSDETVLENIEVAASYKTHLSSRLPHFTATERNYAATSVLKSQREPLYRESRHQNKLLFKAFDPRVTSKELQQVAAEDASILEGLTLTEQQEYVKDKTRFQAMNRQMNSCSSRPPSMMDAVTRLDIVPTPSPSGEIQSLSTLPYSLDFHCMHLAG